MKVHGLLLALSILLVACSDDDDPAEPQDTVSFAAQIEPLLNTTCATAGCHGNPPTRPNNKPMSLSTGLSYDNIVNVSAGELATMMRIRPSKPDSSYLVHKIQGTQATVGGMGQRMPLNLTPLTQVQIDMIRTWVTEGAKRN